MATAKKQHVNVVEGHIVCEYPTLGKTFKGDLSKLSAAIYVKSEAGDHGMCQKFGDAKSGKSPAEKYAEVQLIWASLLDGDWNRTAVHDNTPEILEAVARIKRVPLVKVQEAAKAGGDDVVKTWGQSLDVKAMLKQMIAERAKEAAKAPEAKLGKIAGIDA